MEILICIPCLMTGGTEIQTLNLLHALLGSNHQVTTVCYFEHSGTMIRQFEEAGSRVVCLSPDGARTNGWKGIVFLYKGLRKVVRQVQPQIAHVQYMAPGAIPIFILRLLGVTQIIATAHTAADIYPNLRLVHFIQRRCVRAFTCITEIAEKSFFGSSNLYNESTVLKHRNHFTIYNALPKTFNVIPAERELNNPLTIGVVSRLEMIKGMDLVVPAFAKIEAKHPSAKLIVVGDGTLKDKMQQQATELGCIHSITYTGQQSQQILPQWYQLMDIVLMPSRSEGFGLTAIEAMTQGCVVVASNIGGLPEVVKDGQVGLLHQSENIEDMAEKVNELIDNQSQWAQLSKNAIDYVRRFSMPAYEKLMTDLYSRI